MYNKIIVPTDMGWETISRRVYGLPDRAGEIAKLNNYINSGEILYETDETDEKPVKSVTLTIGETVLTNFAEYRLVEGLECYRGAVFVIDNKDLDVKIGDFATVHDADGLFLKGFVRNIKPNFSASGNWLQVEIKSQAGFLNESHINKEQLESRHLTLKEVLTQILNGFGVKFTLEELSVFDEVFTNSIDTGFSADLNETADRFLRRVCNSRSLAIKDTGDGLFIGKIDTSADVKLNLIDNESIGINFGSARFLTVGLARNYETNTQFPTVASASAATPLCFPILKRYNSADYNGEDVSTAGKIAAKELGDSFCVDYGLSTDLPIRAGSVAMVKDTRLLITTETEFIIETVERQNNRITLLHLVLPCKYTGEIPKELPACRF